MTEEQTQEQIGQAIEKLRIALLETGEAAFSPPTILRYKFAAQREIARKLVRGLGARIVSDLESKEGGLLRFEMRSVQSRLGLHTQEAV